MLVACLWLHVLASCRLTQSNRGSSTRLHLWCGLWVGSSEYHRGFILIGNKCRRKKWCLFQLHPHPSFPPAHHLRSKLQRRKLSLWEIGLWVQCFVKGVGWGVGLLLDSHRFSRCSGLRWENFRKSTFISGCLYLCHCSYFVSCNRSDLYETRNDVFRPCTPV